MGCCLSEEAKEMRVKTKLIDKIIESRRKEDSEVIKILLLGTGESGKSTMIKQMQLIAGEEFEEHERENFRIIIRRNIVTAMQEILDKADDTLEPEFKTASEVVFAADELMEEKFSSELCKALETLWNESKRIRQIYSTKDKLHFPDNAGFFFDHVQRVSAANYVPTNSDILRARNRTTGISEKKLVIHNVKFIFTDVGGQRNERRKWIHCFQGVTAVMFVVAISEYDQVLYEDENASRMQEALNEFHRIVNNEAFEESGMILFLNKTDLLQEKLKTVSFKGKFGYTGEDNFEDVKEYIKNLFEEQATVHDADGKKKNIHPHFTCGLDTENVERVFKDCQKTVLANNLQNMGFM